MKTFKEGQNIMAAGCEKCRHSHNFDVRYARSPSSKECLYITCRNCGYLFKAQCADHKEPDSE